MNFKKEKEVIKLSFPKPKIERKEEDALLGRFTYGIATPNISDRRVPRDNGSDYSKK